MQAGMMRQRVQPYFKMEATDSTGATTFSYAPGSQSCWADLRNTSRRKTDDNGIQPMGSETWECRVRAHSMSSAAGVAIDYGDRIKYQGDMYEIVGLVNVRELNYELILTLERVEIE
tara:strand:+ start:2084 stop:2434 length:351 start_codon:yes stop_codon:yes gene_type:complete